MSLTLELIPLTSIHIPVRARDSTDSDVERHIANLVESLVRFGGHPSGLLQPIIVDEGPTLQDGYCRYHAAKLLSWPTIPCYRRSTLTDFDYQEIELETNFRRLEFTWIQLVRQVHKIHRARTLQANLNPSGRRKVEWTASMTGELLGGYSHTYVHNCLELKVALDDPEKYDSLKDCTGITDALRKVLQWKEDAARQEQARRTSLKPVVVPDFLKVLVEDDDDIGALASVNNTNNNGQDALPNNEQVIDLSNTLLFGDSVRDILPKWPGEVVDHIITDPPYGIDVAMLQQCSNALIDVSRVESSHTVEENLDLFKLMLPQFYKVLKPAGFCVLWCDIMNWQLLYDLATFAGFRVQRWPVVWHKTSVCKNQMAHQNTTKNVEFAIICSKERATLPRPVGSSVIVCANDDEKRSNPFAKPFDAWRYLVESFTTEGQTVLDPFAGEGSATVAFARLNRRSISIEKDNTHYPHLLANVKEYWMKVFNEKVRFI